MDFSFVVVKKNLSDYGLSSFRHLINDGNIEIAVNNHRERSRYGCCRHHEHIGYYALFYEQSPLEHTKTMLLINNNKAELMKGNVFLNNCMGANNDGNTLRP